MPKSHTKPPRHNAVHQPKAQRRPRNPAQQLTTEEKQALESKRLAHEAEEKGIEQMLQERKLFRKPVPKDGACMFRAISELLYDTQAKHLEVREKVASFMEHHDSDFAPFVCEDGMTFTQYIGNMRRPNAWGGEAELQAASRVFSVHFRIYGHPNRVTEVRYENVESSNSEIHSMKTLELCYSHGNHYDTVYPLEFFSRWITAQSIVLELIDKTLGLPIDSDAYATYRNIDMEVWRKGVQAAHLKSLAAAKELVEKENSHHKNIPGYYKKEEEDFEVKSNSRRRRRLQRKAQQISIALPNLPDDSTEVQAEDAEIDEEEAQLLAEEEKALAAQIHDSGLYPELAVNRSPSNSASLLSAASAADSNKNTSWSKPKNWSTVFAPPPPPPASKAASKAVSNPATTDSSSVVPPPATNAESNAPPSVSNASNAAAPLSSPAASHDAASGKGAAVVIRPGLLEREEPIEELEFTFGSFSLSANSKPATIPSPVPVPAPAPAPVPPAATLEHLHPVAPQVYWPMYPPPYYYPAPYYVPPPASLQ